MQKVIVSCMLAAALVILLGRTAKAENPAYTTKSTISTVVAPLFAPISVYEQTTTGSGDVITFANAAIQSDFAFLTSDAWAASFSEVGGVAVNAHAGARINTWLSSAYPAKSGAQASGFASSAAHFHDVFHAVGAPGTDVAYRLYFNFAAGAYTSSVQTHMQPENGSTVPVSTYNIPDLASSNISLSVSASSLYGSYINPAFAPNTMQAVDFVVPVGGIFNVQEDLIAMARAEARIEQPEQVYEASVAYAGGTSNPVVLIPPSGADSALLVSNDDLTDETDKLSTAYFAIQVLTPGGSYYTDSGNIYRSELPAEDVAEPPVLLLAALGLFLAVRGRRAHAAS